MVCQGVYEVGDIYPQGGQWGGVGGHGRGRQGMALPVEKMRPAGYELHGLHQRTLNWIDVFSSSSSSHRSCCHPPCTHRAWLSALSLSLSLTHCLCDLFFPRDLDAEWPLPRCLFFWPTSTSDPSDDREGEPWRDSCHTHTHLPHPPSLPPTHLPLSLLYFLLLSCLLLFIL